MNFTRWEDCTDAAISEWRGVIEKTLNGAPVYQGTGATYPMTIGRATVRAGGWDGAIVARTGVQDWQRAVEHEWMHPSRLGRDGDRRFVDYSDMLPAACRTLRLFADGRIPPGYCLIEAPDGKLLTLVQW